MAITNNNKPGIDVPMWEQLVNAQVASAAGAAVCDDNDRFIYYLASASSFWRYDCWAHTWQQLASPPGGTLAAGSCLRFVREMGAQVSGVVYGSVYALIASGSAVVFYRYNIADNTWTAALSVTNVPAAWGTDGRLVCPDPNINGFGGGYHSNVALNTITASAQANAGATSIAVTALPLALPAGAVLNFGTAAAPVWAVLTASAAAAATSITVSPLIAQVNSAAVAYWYADIFLFGNNSTAVYRYNIAGNAWTTTSANSGNPALATVPAAPGAGMTACWLPGSGDANALDRIILVRGGGTSTIYEYSLTGNTWSTVTYYPSTETFAAGSASGIRSDANGKQSSVIIQKDATGRCFELKRGANGNLMTPIVTQYLVSSGAALVGDRMSVLKHQGIEYCYFIPSTSSYFLRTALFF